MKPAILSVASALVTALAVACSTGPRPSGGTAARQLPFSRSTLAADQLRRMESATAFDALQTMAAYFSRASQRPPARFVLILDGSRVADLEPLKAFKARDLFEIRIVGEGQSLVGSGGVEVIVTTLGRRPVDP